MKPTYGGHVGFVFPTYVDIPTLTFYGGTQSLHDQKKTLIVLPWAS